MQMFAQFRPLRLVRQAQGVEFVLVAQFIAFHADTAVPSAPRRFLSAVRTQVFTVPRGCPMRSAISVWESPSKYASSIALRWFGFSFSIAWRKRRALSEFKTS